jgi:hypothetical protein
MSDARDESIDTARIQELISDVWFRNSSRVKSVDLREFFPDVDHQGGLNSSCSFAVLGLVEYFESRSQSQPVESSRLFLYQMSLRLLGTSDDLGCDLRTALKALCRFGSPPQRFWPYLPERLKLSPTDPFLFGFSREFAHLTYFRLYSDSSRMAGRLSIAKSSLTAGYPFIVGFRVPATLSADGLICDARRAARFRGGQAAIAVGFDDAIRIGSQKGALLIRNSWGSQWGDRGHGWLPYEVVVSDSELELWTVMSATWRSREASRSDR